MIERTKKEMITEVMKAIEEAKKKAISEIEEARKGKTEQQQSAEIFEETSDSSGTQRVYDLLREVEQEQRVAQQQQQQQPSSIIVIGAPQQQQQQKKKK